MKKPDTNDASASPRGGIIGPLRGSVLVMDAAPGPGTVAVLRAGTLLADTSVEMRSMEEERFFPAVLATLERAGVALGSLDAILVGAGPGSFTALRVVGAIAKGLAEGRGIPLFAVPSLALTATPPGVTSVRLDALREECYLATLHRAPSGAISAVEHLGCRPASECAEAIDASPHAREAPHLLALASALGPVDLVSWEPLYGRLAEAQVKWEAAHGRPLRAAPIAFRPATAEDLPAIVSIERRSFSDPWSEATVGEAIAAPTDHCLVVTQGESVVGYGIVRQVGPEAELLNLAVHPAARRQGLGDALLAELLRGLDVQGGVTVFLEVRVSNLAAETLYRRHAFVPVGRRRDYYEAPREDALQMRRAPVGGDD
ncbi:MAG: ribosomal protein S18-alanine N-acetyltransferase [Gemmatimonadota bacterium]